MEGNRIQILTPINMPMIMVTALIIPAIVVNSDATHLGAYIKQRLDR